MTHDLCCDCMCEHKCEKDPRVIGHQGCFACKWCQCKGDEDLQPRVVEPKDFEPRD